MKPLPFFWKDSYCSGNDGRILIPGHVTQSVEFIMLLSRYAFHKSCTRGTLIVGSDIYETLEPPRQEDKPRCIPPGRYRVVMEYSPAFDMALPELKGVPDFTEVKLHVLNYPHQTLGCIGVGLSGGEQYINKSEKALGAIIHALRDAESKHQSLWIEIIESEDTE